MSWHFFLQFKRSKSTFLSLQTIDRTTIFATKSPKHQSRKFGTPKATIDCFYFGGTLCFGVLVAFLILRNGCRTNAIANRQPKRIHL